MSWPVDTLAGVYLFLFAFGLLFSVVTLLLGVVGGHFHLPGSTHVGHSGHLGSHDHDAGSATGHGHGHGHGGGNAHDLQAHAPAAPSPLNVNTLMIFLTWFGATGYILRAYYGSLAATSVVAATAVGLVGAAIVWAFLAKLLWRGQTQLDPANYEIAGATGQLTSSIRAGGTGEVVYRLDGKTRVDGARTLDGAALAAGTEVVLLRYEAGIAYVGPLYADVDALFPTNEPVSEPLAASGRRQGRS